MKTIKFNYLSLKKLVRFTDPFLHTPEKEVEILKYFHKGKLRVPSLIENNDEYLIFNGNHRILVAIVNKLSLKCVVLENMDDINFAQANEGEQFRDISMVLPLTFEGIIKDLIKSAEIYGHENLGKYTC